MHPYQPLLFRPAQTRLHFDVGAMVDAVRAAWFPEIEGDVEVRIAAQPALASIGVGWMGRDRHVITLHPVLDHPERPPEVVRFVIKHELTHVVVRPREVDGFDDDHPPEFWKREVRVAPERHAAWHWINRNLGRCLRRKGGCVAVSGGWRALAGAQRSPFTPWLPFHGPAVEPLCPGAGVQLRLPPDWAARPRALAQSPTGLTPSCGSRQYPASPSNGLMNHAREDDDAPCTV